MKDELKPKDFILRFYERTWTYFRTTVPKSKRKNAGEAKRKMSIKVIFCAKKERNLLHLHRYAHCPLLCFQANLRAEKKELLRKS